MTTLFLSLILFISAFAQADIDPNRLADAIYKAENSVKYPYGVKSIDTHGDKDYARKICSNSIRNNVKRWEKAGKKEDFIVFMGRRYSPPKQNPNWVRLVKHFYNKEKKK
ncbi:MAG: hypothetical protein IMZ53_06260 [Thermoplasmata archaeon]|nr:hypothetical protein [Thermoplasmata archaeon]